MVLLLALLAVTLWFPSTRETQSLCLRWLLHWHGNTFVDGNPTGKNFLGVIPNVRFTPRYAQELCGRSTNSMDDYALAAAAVNYFGTTIVSPPHPELTWENSHILPWAVFKMTGDAFGETHTNAISQASLNSLLPVIHLAKQADPSNGAFGQAEAWLDFGANEYEAAIRALWSSATNKNWNAGSSNSFSWFSHQLSSAGLSEVDAAMQADEIMMSSHSPQSWTRKFLNDLMIQAVNDRKPQEFVQLFRLLVELRRPDWTDKKLEYYNAYRQFPLDDDMVQEMAKQLNIKLSTNWTHADYARQKSIRQQVLVKFLNQYADAVTTASFIAQTESYQTEGKLRIQLSEANNQAYLWPLAGSVLGGFLSLLTLSLLCAALPFEVVILYLRNRTGSPMQCLRETKFRLLSLSVCIVWYVLTTSFASIFAGDSSESEAPSAPPSWVSWNVGSFVSTLIFVFLFGLLLADWKRGKLQIQPWAATRFFLHAYLVCIIITAFFRWQYVAEIVSRYQ